MTVCRCRSHIQFRLTVCLYDCWRLIFDLLRYIYLKWTEWKINLDFDILHPLFIIIIIIITLLCIDLSYCITYYDHDNSAMIMIIVLLRTICAHHITPNAYPSLNGSMIINDTWLVMQSNDAVVLRQHIEHYKYDYQSTKLLD